MHKIKTLLFYVALIVFYPGLLSGQSSTPSNGNYFYSRTDFYEQPKNGFNIELERDYNSYNSAVYAFGLGWESELFDSRLYALPEKAIRIGYFHFYPEGYHVSDASKTVSALIDAGLEKGDIKPNQVANLRPYLESDIVLRSSYWIRYAQKKYPLPVERFPVGMRFYNKVCANCGRSDVQTVIVTDTGYEWHIPPYSVVLFDHTGKKTEMQTLQPDGTVRYAYRLFYDSTGRCNRIVDTNNNLLRIRYNKRGTVEKVTGRNGLFARYRYGRANSLVYSIEQDGTEYEYEYDKIINLTKVTDLGNKLSDSINYNADNKFSGFNSPYFKAAVEYTPGTFEQKIKVECPFLDSYNERYQRYYYTGPTFILDSFLVARNPGDTLLFRFDPEREYVLQCRVDNQVFDYTYDENNRLTRAVSSDGMEVLTEFFPSKSINLFRSLTVNNQTYHFLYAPSLRDTTQKILIGVVLPPRDTIFLPAMVKDPRLERLDRAWYALRHGSCLIDEYLIAFGLYSTIHFKRIAGEFNPWFSAQAVLASGNNALIRRDAWLYFEKATSASFQDRLDRPTRRRYLDGAAQLYRYLISQKAGFPASLLDRVRLYHCLLLQGRPAEAKKILPEIKCEQPNLLPYLQALELAARRDIKNLNKHLDRYKNQPVDSIFRISYGCASAQPGRLGKWLVDDFYYHFLDTARVEQCLDRVSDREDFGDFLLYRGQLYWDDTARVQTYFRRALGAYRAGLQQNPSPALTVKYIRAHQLLGLDYPYSTLLESSDSTALRQYAEFFLDQAQDRDTGDSQGEQYFDLAEALYRRLEAVYPALDATPKIFAIREARGKLDFGLFHQSANPAALLRYGNFLADPLLLDFPAKEAYRAGFADLLARLATLYTQDTVFANTPALLRDYIALLQRNYNNSLTGSDIAWRSLEPIARCREQLARLEPGMESSRNLHYAIRNWGDELSDRDFFQEGSSVKLKSVEAMERHIALYPADTIDLNPSGQYHNLAIDFIYDKQFAPALTWAQKAVSVSPIDPFAPTSYIRALLLNGEYDTAERYFLQHKSMMVNKGKETLAQALLRQLDTMEAYGIIPPGEPVVARFRELLKRE